MSGVLTSSMPPGLRRLAQLRRNARGSGTCSMQVERADHVEWTGVRQVLQTAFEDARTDVWSSHGNGILRELDAVDVESVCRGHLHEVAAGATNVQQSSGSDSRADIGEAIFEVANLHRPRLDVVAVGAGRILVIRPRHHRATGWQRMLKDQATAPADSVLRAVQRTEVVGLTSADYAYRAFRL